MPSRLFHLFWGVTLYTLYTILMAMNASLMRLSPPLLPSQTYALIFVGQFVSFAPFTLHAYRQWRITKTNEWIVQSVLGIVMACSYIYVLYCTTHMPLG